MKISATLFALFIILIIILADLGKLGFLGIINQIPLGDKIGHFTLYGILTLLIDLTLTRSLPPSSTLRTSRNPSIKLRANLIIPRVALILSLIIGLEEYSQQFFPNRTFDLVDLTFSYLGVIFFSWVALKT